MPFQVIGQHAQEHVRAHAIFESMVDRPNLEIIALHRPKWALDFGQFLVRANDIAGAELSRSGTVHFSSELIYI